MAFPLRTNAEIVNILKVYNGSNDIEGISNRVATNRFKRKWFENRNEKGGKNTFVILLYLHVASYHQTSLSELFNSGL